MEIVNIIVSGSFNQKVDLQALMSLGDIYSYNTAKYHGGYIRLSSAKVTVYHSGKYIIYGIKSITQIDHLWRELKDILHDHMDVAIFDTPEIKNIVAKDDMGRGVPLIKIQMVLAGEGGEYEPEVFPGLIWTTEYGTANIFQNGKYILLGCNTMEELEKLNEYVQNRLKQILMEFD